MNVILTFGTFNEHFESQEMFDLNIPLSTKEASAFHFLDKKFFSRVAKKCNQFGRKAEDLIKISTAGNWDLFENITKVKSLPDYNHSCKWYFGNGRDDLDVWEKELMAKFRFGTDIDMKKYGLIEEQFSQLISA